MNRHANGPARLTLVASVLVGVSLCSITTALAQTDARQYEFNIASMPLSQALLQFSQQTQLQLFYSPNDPDEDKLIAGEVKGRHTAAEALQALLPGGFTFVWTNSRTIAVLSPPANAPPGGVQDAEEANAQQHAELSMEQRLSMEHGGGKSGSAHGPYAFDWKATVVGQRIPDSVFVSLDPDVPATVFDRRDIEALGVSSITGLMRYVTRQPHTMPGSYLGDGTQFADLRGLGFDTTLVLINGRRTLATASALTANAFDLNSIPPSAVERIEIVSDSNSALYGADAIGGVVNIVLRENVAEPRVDVDYGAAAGGSVERHAAFSASGKRGGAWGSIVLDYFDRSALLGRERDRWNNQDFTRFGGLDWRSTAASPGNVSSTTLESLPGLPAAFAAIPGATRGSTLTPADFVATAGRRNLDSPLRYAGISDPIARKSAIAQGGFELAPQVSGYGEFVFLDRDLTAQFEPPALIDQLVSGANPHNPFGVDVLVDTLLTDLGPRTFTRRAEMTRAAAGLHGRVGEWDWETSLLNGRDKAATVQSNELDQVRVAAAIAAAAPGDALNVFGGAGANDPALLASLLADPARSRYRTELTQAVASIGGPLASLPAGPLELTLGGEWREEQARYDIAPVHIHGAHRRSIVAGFGELRLPLLAEIPAMHELALVLSGRFDDYSDIGPAFNPEYALIWRPLRELTIRTSYASSFRPPSLFDLYMPRVEVTGMIADPARDNEFAVPVFVGGGNADLGPSSADSLSVGFRFADDGMSGLRVAANYWRIAVDETITIPSALRLLAAEDFFPDRVRRGQPSAADVAAGRPGPLQVVDLRRINNGAVRTSGVDIDASVGIETPMGRFEPELSVTWVQDFSTSDLVDGPDVSRAGRASLQGTVPRWRGVASLGWRRSSLGASAAVRYVPSYDDVDLVGKPNGRKVGSQTIVDVQLSLDLSGMTGDDSAWSGVELRAGAFNLFDAEPAFAAVGGPAGFDLSQGDLVRRFVYLKVAKEF